MNKTDIWNLAETLLSFIEQLLIEKIPDTLENILIELLLEFGEKSIEETADTNTSDTVNMAPLFERIILWKKKSTISKHFFLKYWI